MQLNRVVAMGWYTLQFYLELLELYNESILFS